MFSRHKIKKSPLKAGITKFWEEAFKHSASLYKTGGKGAILQADIPAIFTIGVYWRGRSRGGMILEEVVPSSSPKKEDKAS